MRLVLTLLVILVICYLLLMGVPESFRNLQLQKFCEAMKFEVKDLIDYFMLMPNLAVKLTIIGGAAFLLMGLFRQVPR